MPISSPDANIEKTELLRKEFVRHFTRDFLSDMKLEQYAMGNRSKDNFCYRIEVEQDGFGSIRGVHYGVRRYGVWFDKNINDYQFTKRYGEDVQTAFLTVRKLICDLIDAAEIDRRREAML